MPKNPYAIERVADRFRNQLEREGGSSYIKVTTSKRANTITIHTKVGLPLNLVCPKSVDGYDIKITTAAGRAALREVGEGEKNDD